MNTVLSLVGHVWKWWRMLHAGPRPFGKYRVTARHNPYVFRRALLRDTLVQLKRLCLVQPEVLNLDDPARSDPAAWKKRKTHEWP